MARAKSTGPKKMSGSKAAGVPKRILLKKNDLVKVITGKDKGKTGRVLEVIRDKGRVMVEHVGMSKRHTRPNPAKQIKGGIAERESSIHVSNVMLMTSGGVATRVGMKMEGDKRVRIARKTGEALDKK
jgi:large subunit ribosomal protein L24